MTFGLRCSEPARRPHPASLPVRIPTVESLPSASFSFHLAAGPCGSATVAVIGSDWLLSSNKILPMLGTPCRRLSGGEPASIAGGARPWIILGPFHQACFHWVPYDVLAYAVELAVPHQ